MQPTRIANLSRLAPTVFLGVAMGLALISPSIAQDDGEIDFDHPDRHFRLPNPAELSDADAKSTYDRIQDEMFAAYRLSRDQSAMRFGSWRRYNRVPYRSATHGDRYINNYANAAASAYGQEDAGPMPPGAVLVKDSFTVTEAGDVFTGPLFIMEKMEAGFAPEQGDWRYTMIMPDGSLFGTTFGDGHDSVEFCVGCHAAVGEEYDYLFLVPEEYRAKF